VSSSTRAVTADSSVVIAGFASWHKDHGAALKVLRGVADLVAHAEIESYSVLTRLPEPFQIAPADMAEYLRRRYPGERMVLPESERHGLIARLARLSIAGGSVYDAIVATTAAHHDYGLLSCDRRAAATYDRLGVEVTYL
jgi:predicted nucleic acid-binding protein